MEPVQNVTYVYQNWNELHLVVFFQPGFGFDPGHLPVLIRDAADSSNYLIDVQIISNGISNGPCNIGTALLNISAEAHSVESNITINGAMAAAPKVKIILQPISSAQTAGLRSAYNQMSDYANRMQHVLRIFDKNIQQIEKNLH